MDLNQAIKNISYYEERFANDEILCIREHKEEAIPIMLELLASSIETYKEATEWPDDMLYPFYTIYLLAEFKVREAFDLYVQILELSEEACDILLGDCLTNDMGSILATVATTGDIGRIKAIVENRSLYMLQRLAALEALVTMYLNKMYPCEDLSDYLGQLLSFDDDDAVFLTFVACICYGLGTGEHYARICWLFEQKKLEFDIIEPGRFEKKEPNLCQRIKPARADAIKKHRLITDTIDCLEDWACFRTSDQKPGFTYDLKTPGFTPSSDAPIIKPPKVGRNDPCPCGGGKKFKHCCGKNA